MPILPCFYCCYRLSIKIISLCHINFYLHNAFFFVSHFGLWYYFVPLLLSDSNTYFFCFSPNGAYSTGFKPITHQVIEGMCSDVFLLYLFLLILRIHKSNFRSFHEKLETKQGVSGTWNWTKEQTPSKVKCTNILMILIRSSLSRF